MAKVSIKQVKYTYDVSFKGLTAGEVLSIKNALHNWSASSPVAADVLQYLRNSECTDQIENDLCISE